MAKQFKIHDRQANSVYVLNSLWVWVVIVRDIPFFWTLCLVLYIAQTLLPKCAYRPWDHFWFWVNNWQNKVQNKVQHNAGTICCACTVLWGSSGCPQPPASRPTLTRCVRPRRRSPEKVHNHIREKISANRSRTYISNTNQDFYLPCIYPIGILGWIRNGEAIENSLS